MYPAGKSAITPTAGHQRRRHVAFVLMERECARAYPNRMRYQGTAVLPGNVAGHTLGEFGLRLEHEAFGAASLQGGARVEMCE